MTTWERDKTLLENREHNASMEKIEDEVNYETGGLLLKQIKVSMSSVNSHRRQMRYMPTVRV